jgi:parallel beta-helix repeat protein/predicted outer membrane repeat protein
VASFFVFSVVVEVVLRYNIGGVCRVCRGGANRKRKKKFGRRTEMKKAVLFLTLVLLAVPCAAEIIIVDDGGYGDFDNIQAAIDDSNDGDIIYVLPGTYTGTGNRDIDYGGRAVTVTGVEPQDPYFVAATVIDCQSAGRGFYFHTGEGPNSVLTGLTITNGYADYGGGIHCYDSSPTIADCIIRDNSALYRGGGIYCYYSNLIIVDCEIRDNITTTGNTSGAYGGGGIYCYRESPRIAACTITGNSSNTDGGGVYCGYMSVPSISNCEFIENTAARWGGGICTAGTNPQATACVFNGNTAQYGGGIYSGSGDPDLRSCTLSGNTASTSGGGLYRAGGWPILTNCTFSGNVAQAGSGGGICGGSSLLTNCALWANSDSGTSVESAQITGGASTVCFSCIQDDDPNDANIPFGGAESNNIDDCPMFVRDASDGGDGWGDDPCTPGVDEGANDDFGDLHLQGDSPCINAGSPLGVLPPDSLDMDGEPRVMGLVADIGADEYLIRALIVTRPEGGEVWVSESSHQIAWLSEIDDGPLDILFSSNGGTDWDAVETGAENTGIYPWHLPAVDSNQCVIAVVPSVPDANVIPIESGLFTIHPDSPGPPVVSKWESLGGDYDRTGQSENYGPVLGCVKWEFEVDGAISAGVTIGPNDTVYVPCEDGNLYKLDSNGVVIWSYEAGSPLISSPSIGPDGTVYVGAANGRLYAVDIDGNLRWTHSTGGMVYSSPAVSGDGNNIYVGSQDGRLYALGRDGSELWSFETVGFGVTDGAIFSSPTVGTDGTVYVGGLYDPNLYALEPNDGSIKWVCHFGSNGWPFASPVVGPNETIYQTLLYDPNLYAIDANDGSIRWATNVSGISWAYWYYSLVSYSRWLEPYYYDEGGSCSYPLGAFLYVNPQYDAGESVWSEPVLGPDGTLYVSLDDPYIRAVDPNGSIKWIRKVGSTMGFNLTVGNDGLIYAASNDSNLYVIDTDGFEIARFDSNDYWLGFPVISADNTIIFGDSRDNSMLISYENNKLWAIGGDNCQGRDPNLYWQGGAQDLDGSGTIDFIDFAIVAQGWLQCTECSRPCIYDGDIQFLQGDVNRDLHVDFLDVAILAEKWLWGY